MPESAFEQKVRLLSKGMRQKLGIAIAILRDTPAIVLDEATAGLDPNATAEFEEILKDLRNDGKAILMSSRDIFRVKSVSDRVGILTSGRLVMEQKSNILQYDDLVRVHLKYMSAEPGDTG